MKEKSYRIIIAGGGTGGHLFPAIAIGDELISNGAKIKYIGSKYGIESNYKFIDKKNIELLDLRGLQRTLSLNSLLKNILLPYKLIKSFFQVHELFKNYKPDFVIGTGGYSCAIPLFLAFRKKILTAIQEQNVLPGMVTKKLSNKVDFIFTSFAETNEYLPNNNNLFYTGNPIRSIIKSNDKIIARNKYKLSLNKFTILIIGGSQGAKAINDHFLSKHQYYLDKDIQLIWQIGSYSNNILKDIKNPNIKIRKFINNMGIAYSASDLIVSRAGATAISEITYLGKPSILIPYPYAANNHQEINAKILEKNNASLMLKEEQLRNGELENIISNSSKFLLKMDNMKINAIKFSKKNSASLIAEKIINEIDNAR